MQNHTCCSTLLLFPTFFLFFSTEKIKCKMSLMLGKGPRVRFPYQLNSVIDILWCGLVEAVCDLELKFLCLIVARRRIQWLTTQQSSLSSDLWFGSGDFLKITRYSHK
jgi:hypothetical protein